MHEQSYVKTWMKSTSPWTVETLSEPNCGKYLTAKEREKR